MIDFQSLREEIKNKKIIVFGDLRLDKNNVGYFEGMSREIDSMPLFNVEHYSYNPGGAANLCACLAALGAQVYAVGVIGLDSDGLILKERLRRSRVNADYVVDYGVTGSFEKDYFKSGIHVAPRTILASVLDKATLKAVASNVQRLADAARCDAMIVADYDAQGRSIINYVTLEAIRCIDVPKYGTSRNDVTIYHDFQFLMGNYKEINAEPASYLGNAVFLLITHEAKGADVFGVATGSLAGRATTKPLYPPLDACGAGDALNAMFVLSWRCNIGMSESLQLGNAAARWTCKQLYGVGGYPTMDDIEKEHKEIYGEELLNAT